MRWQEAEMATKTLTAAQKLVDELGKVRAAMAPFAARETEIKDELIKLSKKRDCVIDGRLFHSTLTWCPYSFIDAKKARKVLDEKTLKRITGRGTKPVIKVTAHLKP